MTPLSDTTRRTSTDTPNLDLGSVERARLTPQPANENVDNKGRMRAVLVSRPGKAYATALADSMEALEQSLETLCRALCAPYTPRAVTVSPAATRQALCA